MPAAESAIRSGVFEQIRSFEREVQLWRIYNQTWLDRFLGGDVATGYTEGRPLPQLPRKFGWKNAYDHANALTDSVDADILILESTAHCLPLWVPLADSAAPAVSTVDIHVAPIFIVHGHDTLRAGYVARTVQAATGRDTVILREQASLGQTLIEKFEHHATQAAYAIIVLTPDDHGGPATHDTTNPRARQNVIFEMGYFYGILGRHRVCALLHPDVEIPSDTDGIIYIRFDDTDGWKTALYRELAHAKIPVDITRAI